MKQIFTLLVAALCSISFVWASRAVDTPVKIIQKDGTTITIRVHGDEFSSYVTTVDGYQIVWRDGFYYYYQTSMASKSSASFVRASDPGRRSAAELAALASRPTGRLDGGVVNTERKMSYSLAALDGALTKSSQQRASVQPARAIVVLVQFSDVKFQQRHDQTAFRNLLNQAGYNLNGGTGSAKDYFSENSMGRYTPQFDISPIVTLPENRDFYGENKANGSDKNADLMVAEGCKLASAAGVDFSQYDTNKDGKVDNVFVYYAGNNEAEGASASTVWPHRWALYNYRNTIVNGVQVWDYACTSELRGAQSTTMAGIGTFCHEFGHVLGLPDVYDTDGAAGGSSVGLYNVSIMCGGNYNNGGNTPPYYNALERALLGWTELVELEADKNITLDPIQTSNKAYRISSKASPDEFYLLEARKPTGWDVPLKNSGLLIYHVDRSTNNAAGASAISRWGANTLNNNKEHECFRFVESVGRNLVNSEMSNMLGYGKIYYPGTPGKREFNESSYRGIDWKGNPVRVELMDINDVSGVVSFATASLVKGDGNFEVEVAQREAVVQILTDVQCDGFVVAYKRNSTVNWSEIVVPKDERRLSIIDLQPETVYDFQLYAVNGSERTSLARLQMTTKAITAPYAVISGMKASFSVGEVLKLQIANTTETPRSVVFSLDGQDIVDPQIVLPGVGKYTLRATITYKNGSKEVLTRKITVK